MIKNDISTVESPRLRTWPSWLLYIIFKYEIIFLIGQNSQLCCYLWIKCKHDCYGLCSRVVMTSRENTLLLGELYTFLKQYQIFHYKMPLKQLNYISLVISAQARADCHAMWRTIFIILARTGTVLSWRAIRWIPDCVTWKTTDL